jgi:hypothetical protein
MIAAIHYQSAPIGGTVNGLFTMFVELSGYAGEGRRFP